MVWIGFVNKYGQLGRGRVNVMSCQPAVSFARDQCEIRYYIYIKVTTASDSPATATDTHSNKKNKCSYIPKPKLPKYYPS